MAFDGLRARLRSIASDGGEQARETADRAVDEGRTQLDRRRREAAAARRAAARAAKGRAPAADLDDVREPKGTRKAIARRVAAAGEVRKPIPDATLEPGKDPRQIEAAARGDAGVGHGYFDDMEQQGDPYQQYFVDEAGVDAGANGPFVMEMLDERDHEAGLYAYEDEHETGGFDDPKAWDDPFGLTGGDR